MNEIKITIPLPTHIRKTENKVKADKYMKINNQAIYNGALNRFARAIVVNYLHAHFSEAIDEQYKNLNIDSKNVSLTYEFHTVFNHGNARKTAKGISWTPATKGYIPNWDLDNLADIWSKIGNDTLVLEKVLKDDNVGIVKEEITRFVEIKELFDAKIELTIKY